MKKPEEQKPMVYKQENISVYYYHYKEPFVKFEDGFGFEGALAYSEDKKMIQCHFCGNFFKAIRYSHLTKCTGVKLYECKHDTIIENVDDYKKAVGLNKSAVLVGEETRLKLVEKSQEPKRKLHRIHWKDKDMVESNKKKLIEANKRRTGERITMEKRNKFGTCPVQLLERIKEVKESLGHTPSKKEFYTFYKGKYIGAIYQVYGSWVTAVEKAGYTPVSKEPDGLYRFTDEELLAGLQEFYVKHKRLSSYSDHTRGLLPSYDTYIRHFGSMNMARRKAQLPVVYKLAPFKYSYDYSSCAPKYMNLE